MEKTFRADGTKINNFQRFFVFATLRKFNSFLLKYVLNKNILYTKYAHAQVIHVYVCHSLKKLSTILDDSALNYNHSFVRSHSNEIKTIFPTHYCSLNRLLVRSFISRIHIGSSVWNVLSILHFHWRISC